MKPAALLATVLVALPYTPCMSATIGQQLREIANAPYQADAERARLIRDRHGDVARGMGAAEVIALLGEPDAVRPLFAPRKHRPDEIGRTWWYLVGRRSATGSVEERGERAVRVSFDLDGRVTDVVSTLGEHPGDR